VKRFRFGLEPVLDMRTRNAQERQRVYAEAQRAHAKAEARLRALQDEYETLRMDLVEHHGGLDVETMRSTYAHLEFLVRAQHEQRERIAACADECIVAQEALLHASKEKKVIETLKIRRRATYDAEMALIEQRELDDANARAFGRVTLQRGESA
jgi:flagellar FliJ protein